MKELEKAIRLYPSNVRIQKEFDRFKKENVYIKLTELQRPNKYKGGTFAVKIADYLAEHAEYCFSQGYEGSVRIEDVDDLAKEVQNAVDKELLGDAPKPQKELKK